MNNSVGNDLVDLNSPEARLYASDTRFVARVLTDSEQEYYYQNYSPLTFWMHWAAKEAVYKVIKKLEPDAVFSHRMFEFKPEEISETIANGTVLYKNVVHQVKFTITADWIHCTTSTPGTKKILTLIRHNDKIENCDFSGIELGSIYSKESKLVRSLAKRLLKEHFKKDYEIRRPMLDRKFGPPEIWCEGKRVHELDLSLSHDHQYCAVSVGIGPRVSIRVGPSVS